MLRRNMWINKGLVNGSLGNDNQRRFYLKARVKEDARIRLMATATRVRFSAFIPDPLDCDWVVV